MVKLTTNVQNVEAAWILECYNVSCLFLTVALFLFFLSAAKHLTDVSGLPSRMVIAI